MALVIEGIEVKRKIWTVLAVLLAVICLGAFAAPSGTLAGTAAAETAETAAAETVTAETAEAAASEDARAEEAPAEAASAEPEQAEAAQAENAAAEAAPAEGTLISSKTARIFDGTLDSAQTLTVWDAAGQEDVPYVPLREYLTVMHEDAHASSLGFAWEGNVYVITKNGVNIRVDLDAQTIRCEDWRSFQGASAEGALPAGIVEKSEFIAIRPSQKHESTQTAPSGYEIHMADYGFQMIRHEDDVLMPFALAQSAFGSPFMQGVLGYNGDDFFNLAGYVDIIYGNEGMSAAPNPYANRWFSGRFAKMTQMSEAYAKYNYAAICLMLDLTYGHKEEKGITSFDAFFQEQGLKDALTSVNPADDAEALEKMFSVQFDSGHDGTMLAPSVFASEGIIERQEMIHLVLQLIGYDTVAGLVEDAEPLLALAMKAIDSLTEEDVLATNPEDPTMGPGVQELTREALRMMLLKPFTHKKNSVEIVGDTAVIYFEEFAEDLNRTNSFYTKLPTKEDLDRSTFALVYHAFEKIKNDGNVKNVVFDVTNNGGGSAAALVTVLGFLSKDGEVNITYRDRLNKSDVSEYYHVDTNLDGRFDDQDGYGGQYNFYIMTSGSSYSCANALPYFAQRDHQAKVIGQQPGGGDCVVGYYVDATGRVGGISGFLQLGTLKDGVFVSNEDAVVPDLPMTDEEVNQIFFHPDKIAEFIASHTK